MTSPTTPVVIALVCAASLAHADDAEPPPDSRLFFGAPIELGATSREDGRFFYGLRPEFMFSQHGNRGLAYGAYAELARSSGDTSLNAGVTVTWLLHSKLSFAPSLGAYHRFADVGETGYAVGIFIGRRDTDASGGLDVPIGIRIDYRADLSDHHEVIVCAQIDILALAARAVFGGYTGGSGF